MSAFFRFRGLLALLAVLGGLWGLANDTLAGREGLVSTSVEEVLAHRHAPPAYLSVKGRLLTEKGFTRQHKQPGGGNFADARLFPLVDETQALAVLVEIRNPVATGAPVAGMLRPMPRKLQEAVSNHATAFPGMKINTDYILVQGDAPAGWIEWGAVAGAFSVIALAFFAMKRYRASASQPVEASKLLGLSRVIS
jgi:hypothetical protein